MQGIRAYIVLIVLAIFCQINSYAQEKNPLVQEAIENCNSGNLVGAKQKILLALQDKKAAIDPETWYVKGYIYKEIFKNVDKESRLSDNREIAVDAVLRSMELDTDRVWQDYNQKAIKYLAISFYNHSIEVSSTLNKENHEEALALFSRFEQLYPLYNNSADIQNLQLDFYGSMGTGFRKIYEQDRDRNSLYLQQAISYYDKMIAIKPEHYGANYNAGICHYNQAAYRASKINFETEIFELIAIQDECLKSFKKALPYVLAAEKLDPERINTLKALMAIYRSMNDQEKSDFYFNKMQDLIKKGEIKN
jgi:hypothetical protein